MTIFYSGGDKGGTGKSWTSSVLVDYLMAAGHSVAIIEGDLGQPDIALRFKGAGVEVRAVNLNRSGAAEAAVIKFAEALVGLDGKDIVVNLPSAAGDTLDALAALLVEAGMSLGHETCVLYSIGHQATSTQGALRSLREGLLGATKRRCIIYPQFLQPDVERFDFVRSGARSEYLAAGGLEAAMPALRPEDLVNKVLATPGTFSDLAKPDSALTFGERLFFNRQWLPSAHKAVAVLVNGG
ncbi:MAG: hypothetical protein ACYCXT_11050 [Acidiferrobacteraceae bacterium]